MQKTCLFVEAILADGNRRPMERQFNSITIVFPVTQEVHQSELTDHDGWQHREADLAFLDRQ